MRLHGLEGTGTGDHGAQGGGLGRAGELGDAARAASRGNMTAFRADFGRVAPHGYPTGPDTRALDRASAPFPFRACGKSNGI